MMANFSSCESERRESPKKTKVVMDRIDMNDQILAGVEFRIQYLGRGELSKFGGTDDEIARVIHDIHGLYDQRKSGIKEAGQVLVYIDTQRINVYSKNEDDTLLSFPLTHVRDVTACLNQPAYSKTCVLVAKENSEPLYKAYVFYCKTAKKAAQFYKVASLSFQLGFDLLNKFGNFSCDKSDWNGSMEIITKDTKECEIKETENASFERDDKQHGIYEERRNTIENTLSQNNNRTRERTVAVQLQSENNSATWKDGKGYMKIDLGLGERDSNLNQSKMRVYVENLEERSRFLLSRWCRSSYRKFCKISDPQSTSQLSAEEVQL